MSLTTLFYALGIVFFLLFSLLILFFLFVSISTYLKIKHRINELKDTKLLFSTFQKALERPGKVILPLIGFFTALFFKLRKEKEAS